MYRTTALFLPALAILVLSSGCGVFREPEQASSPIEAAPLVINTGQPAAEVTSTDSGTINGLNVYSISQADSEVRFELDEDLRGNRKTVVGTTDQVAGEIALDLNDLSTAQVGIIQINARTLATDSNLRNRAIQNEILDTGSFEYVTFAPAAINGLPASIAIGEEVTFSIEGNLTIRDITRPVIFQVVAQAFSDTQLSGTASAVINRTDFDLNIPSVPNVANVEEEVELHIDFVASAS
jgi:polyisoprenoid-binding protein YceI